MASYIALYRKYRPNSFAELVGQEPIARTLTSAITQNRLAHAYLFCGPRGTGKTSVARILAKSVNCKAGATATPCGTCTNCIEITAGSNLDVIEIDAASNNGVDNIRDLQDRVSLAPVSGRYKVYIIDEVHMLSQGAFNALLKTLEEPPPNVLFILATTDPHKVLPTIVSRCQRFDFGRIALAALVDRLAYVAGQEGIPAETGALEAISRRANGGLRDALSLFDQLAASAMGAPLTAAGVATGLGLVSGDEIVALADGLVRGDAPAALAVAAALLMAGHDHAVIARELLTHFRHLMVLQVAPDRAAALDVPIAHQAQLVAQAEAVPAAEVPWILEVLNEMEGTIRRSPQQAIWLELGLIKVARRPAIGSLVELSARVAALEAAVGGGGSVAAAPVRRPVQPVHTVAHTVPVEVPPAPVSQPVEAATSVAPSRAPALPSPVPAPPVAVSVPVAAQPTAAPGDVPPADEPFWDDMSDSLPDAMPSAEVPRPVVAPPRVDAPIQPTLPPVQPTLPPVQPILPPVQPILPPVQPILPQALPPRPLAPVPDLSHSPFPDSGLPPRPPLAVLEGGAAGAIGPKPVVPTPAAQVPGGATRPVPPRAWERVHEYVRQKSVPTAALLSQQAAIDGWEADGAVIIRMGKAFKETFERQPAKRTLLAEAIAAVFGADSFPRIETGDAVKSGAKRTTSTGAQSQPPTAFAPAAPPPRLAPAPPPLDAGEPPIAEGPPAWLDEQDDSRPPDIRPEDSQAVARPVSLSTQGEDDAVKRTMEIFSGKLIAKLEE